MKGDGSAAEALAALALTQEGFDVALPVFRQPSFDMISKWTSLSNLDHPTLSTPISPKIDLCYFVLGFISQKIYLTLLALADDRTPTATNLKP